MNVIGTVRRSPIVTIIGATGTGKTDLGIFLANKFNGEVVNADSMQIYKGLNIVTNKPSPAELEQCKHHLLDYLDPLRSTYKITEYQRKALPIVDQLLSQEKLPIIVGGTNYYIESLLWNFLIVDNKQTSVSLKRKLPCQANYVEEIDESNHDAKNDFGNTSDLPKSVSNDEESERDDIRSKLELMTSEELYAQLKELDIETALRIHPNDRRKLIRAIEIAKQVGVPMSHILNNQHRNVDMSVPISGSLRYQDALIIWIDVNQDILDERINKRVDKMIKKGLIDELHAFHENYNAERCKESLDADYTLGIFQSIGFKEFHSYLLLPKDEQDSSAGKKMFDDGVETMKRATRQYARKQIRWIKNRLLKRDKSTACPIYALDGSDLDKWFINVCEPAKSIITSIIDGENPQIQPLELKDNTNLKVFNVCDACNGKVFVNLDNWNAHMNSRKHKKAVRSKKILEKLSEIESIGNEIDNSEKPKT